MITGLAVGFGLGLLIAWGLMPPASYIDTTPASLRIDFKDEYRYMIALAYEATGDLPRAHARIASIEDPDSRKALGEQAQRMLANNSPMQVVQVLADLSEAMQNQITVAPPPVASQDTQTQASQPAEINPTTPSNNNENISIPTDTSEPAATLEPGLILTQEDTPPATVPVITLAARPRPSATPTPGQPFELVNQASQCEPNQPGLLQIYLVDTTGKPATGIELVITWFGGEEHFFTGLKPEISAGYADYKMEENIEYALSLSVGGTRVTNLSSPPCIDASGNTYPGSIRLDFKQP